MAESQDVQRKQADARGRGHVENFEVEDLILLNAKNLPTNAISTSATTHPAGPAAQRDRSQERTSGAQPTAETRTTPSADGSPRYHLRNGRANRSPSGKSLHGDERIVQERSSPHFTLRDSPVADRRPSTLLDERGELHFHVERLLARRRHRDHTQYLVKWRGEPNSYNSWEYEVPLRQDCPEAVDAFNQSALRDRDHEVGRLLLPDASQKSETSAVELGL